MDDGLRLRLREPPVGGARVAFSYLATLCAAILTALVFAAWSPFGASVCAGSPDGLCVLGWWMAGAIVGGLLGLGAAAWVFRLGWEWWAVAATLVLVVPTLTLGPWAAVGALLGPALAGLATWSGPERPSWRPWLIGGASLVAAIGVLLWLFVW